jgi:LasA protease
MEQRGSMMKIKHKITPFCIVLLLSAPVLHADDRPDAVALPLNPATSALIYSYDEMFHFNIEQYLASQAPHLLPYTEVISHWAGYTSISPRVLLTLIDLQSQLISQPDLALLQQPLAGLSTQQGFSAQLQDVADQLARRLYQRETAASEFAAAPATALSYLFGTEDQKNAEQAQFAEGKLSQFSQRYQQLFAESYLAAPDNSAQGRNVPEVNLLAGPANGFLQFPFPLGQSWHVGGAHTNTGSGNYPMSSLDMSLGGGWGSNQSNTWVAASAAGSFKRHSSCFAEIVHSGGWSTTYYHLMNIQYNTGANVAKNTKIANPANTQPQALCNGGASTGPHQHWSLKQNGSWVHLNTVYLSGWQITATGSSYDTNCTRFYLTKNGVKKCSGWFSH